MKEEGILKKITEAELGYSYDGHFKKGIFFSPDVIFFFDTYTEDYVDSFARFLLRNNTTNSICEIFEYSLPTFLKYNYFVYEIDLFISCGYTKYFYNREKLIFVTTGTDYIITNYNDYVKQ